MVDVAEITGMLNALGLTTISSEDIEQGLALNQCATILHSLSCKKNDHTETGCDFYQPASKDKKKWREEVLSEIELLDIDLLLYRDRLVMCLDLIQRNKDVDLTILIKVANRILARAPKPPAVVSDSFSIVSEMLEEGHD